jgi:dihydropyrimidinase
MKTLIKNGAVCLEDGLKITDVLVVGGQIAEVGKIDYAIADCEVLDAKGLHVLPGLIDIHTHLDDKIGKYQLADTWASGSEIAAINGITTLCTFITQQPGRPLKDAVERALGKAENRTYCDQAFHLTPVSFAKSDWSCIEKLLAEGFKTFKFYTTYREAGLFLEYAELMKAMSRIGEMGAKVLIHCEDDAILSAARSAISDPAKAFSHALSRPPSAEIEGIKRILEIAEKTKCPCHIVHVSTAEGARLIAQARQDLPVTCETGPQYLFLDDEELKEPEGHRYICSPPLRSESNRAEMQALALKGTFDVYATDHCAFLKADKDKSRSDFTKVPNGLAGIGALVPLIHEFLRDLGTLARHLALNPAKIAGLYPQKGVIRKGSDADLVMLGIQSPERPLRSSLADVYESYPGKTTGLSVKRVWLRGETVAENGKLKDPINRMGKRV